MHEPQDYQNVVEDSEYLLLFHLLAISSMQCLFTTNLRIELFANVLLNLVHDGFNLLIIHGLLLILKEEIHSVTLLSFFKILAFIYVEEAHFLKHFLLALICNLFDFTVFIRAFQLISAK